MDNVEVQMAYMDIENEENGELTLAVNRAEHLVGSVQNRTEPNRSKTEIWFFFPDRIDQSCVMD